MTLRKWILSNILYRLREMRDIAIMLHTVIPTLQAVLIIGVSLTYILSLAKRKSRQAVRTITLCRRVLYAIFAVLTIIRVLITQTTALG